MRGRYLLDKKVLGPPSNSLGPNNTVQAQLWSALVCPEIFQDTSSTMRSHLGIIRSTGAVDLGLRPDGTGPEMGRGPRSLGPIPCTPFHTATLVHLPLVFQGKKDEGEDPCESRPRGKATRGGGEWMFW